MRLKCISPFFYKFSKHGGLLHVIEMQITTRITAITTYNFARIQSNMMEVISVPTLDQIGQYTDLKMLLQ